MAHAEHLQELLRPLGVYDLSPQSLSGSELQALGVGLDAVEETLNLLEREGCLATAEGEGLFRLDTLFSHSPVHLSSVDHRMALNALMSIGLLPPSLSALNLAIRGCGILARVQETDTYGLLQVDFPHTVGVPENFDNIQQMILDLLPCHLQTEFYFRFLLWSECEALSLTWSQLEQMTWMEWQTAVSHS